MAVIHIERIKTALEKLFDGRIDMSDYDNRPEDEGRKAFLSRAVAAYALTLSCNTTPEVAGKAVVDGFDDNGIDLVHYDEQDDILFVGQSKWIESGDGSIAVGDCKKFLDGFRDLVNLRLDRFNDKLRSHETLLKSALLDANVRIGLILAYSGAQAISDHVQRDIDAILEEMNDPVELVSVEVFNQARIYNGIAGHAQRPRINLEVMLQEWGHVEHPFDAYYGQVDLASVANWWKGHGQSLFARNIRNFRGSTDVNKGLETTLSQEADRFWYYNNGVTLLCSKIAKKPLGGPSRDSGIFECEGVSVVNGAQTVGVIGRVSETLGGAPENATVLIRLISLEHCPDGFDKSLTRATNTQNRIERRDFAALDPNQHRLASELLLDGKRYAYKSGDPDPDRGDGCSLTDATVALACADPDVGLAVQAKREIGRLWEDIEGPPYTSLFNDRTSATVLWRAVEIMWVVEDTLKGLAKNRSGRAGMIAVHGNRLILHRVFQHPDISGFRRDSSDFGDIKRSAQSMTVATLDGLAKHLEDKHAGAYLASFFKNQNKCRDVDQFLQSSEGLDSRDVVKGKDADSSTTQRTLF